MGARAELRTSRNSHIIGALRPHHWPKNLLVLVPLLAAHHFGAATWTRAAAAFLCFCCAASSGYLINDLFDVDADRTLPYKGGRSIASGDLSRGRAIAWSAALAVAALGGSFLLSQGFCLLLLAYLAVSFTYSYFLKSKIIVDVILIAALLSARVIGGSVVSGIAPSNWLIIFCLFMFFSLSLAKRCSEISARTGEGRTAIPRRGYKNSDLPVLTSLGTAAAYGAVLVLAEYIASPEVKVLYARVDWLWVAVPLLLYWLSRIFVLSNRGELGEDPVVFAAFDRVTWGVGGCLAIVFLLAI